MTVLAAYSFFVAVGQSDESYAEINVGIEMEQLRLLAFLDAAHLLDDDGAQHLSPQQRLIIIAVLKQIEIKVDGFAGLINYASKAKVSSSDPPTFNDVKDYDEFSIVGKYASTKEKWSGKARARAHARGTNHIRQFWNTTKHVWHNPRSLKWALNARDKYKAILKELTKYTQYLESMMQGESMRRLLESQHRTEVEVILVREDVTDLKRIFESTVLLTMQSQSRLRNLAQTKVLSLSLQDADADTARPPPSYESATDGSRLIPIDQVQHFNLPTSTSVAQRKRSGAQYIRNGPDGTHIDVWIEWKALKFHFDDEGYEVADTSSVRRVEDLVSLLQESHAPAKDIFRIPECLGYINLLDYRDPKGSRTPVERVFGLLYRKPYKPNTSSSTSKVTAKAAPNPVSLLELLTSHPIPSLTIRASLAQRIADTLLYFHTVRWFHKALRSDAIVFHRRSDGSIDHTDPLVTGFESSRPDREQTQSTTEGSAGELQNMLYVHPRYQVAGTGAEHHYLRSFDAYSLGIVLLEIAYWKPVGDILRVEVDGEGSGVGVLTQKFVKSVRDVLLAREGWEKSCHVEVLKETVGERYFGAVKGCIEGFVDLDKEKEVVRQSDAARVREHLRFMEVVVDGLGGVVV